MTGRPDTIVDRLKHAEIEPLVKTARTPHLLMGPTLVAIIARRVGGAW